MLSPLIEYVFQPGGFEAMRHALADKRHNALLLDPHVLADVTEALDVVKVAKAGGLLIGKYVIVNTRSHPKR